MAYVRPSQTVTATAASTAVTIGRPAAWNRTPSTSMPATTLKKPKIRSGARTSSATLDR
jgi:hypothetical protein